MGDIRKAKVSIGKLGARLGEKELRKIGGSRRDWIECLQGTLRARTLHRDETTPAADENGQRQRHSRRGLWRRERKDLPE